MEQAARIQCLRVRDPAVVVAQVKQQVSRWLEAQTPTRLGLPAQAIVVLRSVHAPWSALQPDSPADVLGAQLRQAARPASGTPLGAGCDAVWFADEAELLACLARDHLQGQLGHRWWWQTWLGQRPSGEGALRAWLASARTVPAAMARLHAMGDGLAWGHHIGAAGRLALLQAMWPHHPITPAAATWLPQALADALPVHTPGEALATITPGTTAAPHTVDAPHTTVRQPHPDMWAGWRAHGGAAVWQALCAVLADTPHLALDERRLADRLQSALGAHGTAGAPQPQPPQGTPPDHPTPLAGAKPHRAPAATSSPIGPAPTPTGRPVRVSRAEPPHPGAPTPDAPLTRPDHATQHHSCAAPGEPLPAVHTADLGTPRPGPTRPPLRPSTPLPRAPWQSTQTAHGGVFFLLNVALAWELYGDFTRPRHALLSVSPWQFLHAAAFALLGRAFAADPLAAWLREQVPFSRPRPASALGDTPLNLLPATEAHQLRAADSQATFARRSARRHDELCAWWPLLGPRLALALNLPEDEAIATCLKLPARIDRQADRVDVGMSLHHLPLSIRLAGLDRNPGWVPASGCDIRFHFEA